MPSTSYFFQAKPLLIDGGVVFIAFISDALFGLKNASKWSDSSTNYVAGSVSFLQVYVPQA